MKNRFRMGFVIALALSLGACSLDRTPISDFSEITEGGKTNSGTTVKFKTRDAMKSQYDALYNQLKGDGGLRAWGLDFFIYTDTHADNSYRGATDAELTQLEQQKQDGINKNIDRDWGDFYKVISVANSVIVNIDSVPDVALTAAERKQWKAEALILRAMYYFDMVRLWGDVPLVITEPPAITAANLVQVYPLYYPKRDSAITVYRQIVKDLNIALQPGGAPALNAANKFVLSKTLAYAMLAKIYAEKPLRDYGKVALYCDTVEQSGVSLMASYGDLFDMNSSSTDVKYRNMAESIFEITFSGSGGNWLTSLYGVDASDAGSKYDWAKWLTPSRDLMAAFDLAKDTERKKQTITTATVTWSNHYPSKDYPFMYKFRSKFHSLVKVRLADIILLHAEALVEKDNLSGAATLVNKIRTRAKLPNLDNATVASKTMMQDAVLLERRLELAFEGQRWFDLVRTGKVKEVLNGLNKRDVGRLPMDLVTDESTLLPLPQAQIDINPSMTQNKGY